jgi:hypothetical protein
MKNTWLAVLLICFGTAIAWGQNTDYQLQISCSAPGCSTGIGTGSIAGEVNGISGNTITILENGNGSPAVEDPVLLIIGVPNTAGAFVPPSVTVNGQTFGLATQDFWGGSYPTNGTGVTFNASNGTDAYAALGLGSAKTGQASESFGNWQTANSQLGLSTTSYTLYVYALTGTNLSGGKTASVTFNGSLPLGTFIIAYSCSTGSNTQACTQQGDNMGATPFTVAGEVPEPTTLALLGTTGLLGLAGVVRRKFRI